MKYHILLASSLGINVAPVRERGLKYPDGSRDIVRREVAPVRERGLKSGDTFTLNPVECRSRKGAWIEIDAAAAAWRKPFSRSRKGAWIEIPVLCLGHKKDLVAPVRERGLKSAWPNKGRHNKRVAPVRERGLKSDYETACNLVANGRSRKGAWIEIYGWFYWTCIS